MYIHTYTHSSRSRAPQVAVKSGFLAVCSALLSPMYIAGCPSMYYYYY